MLIKENNKSILFKIVNHKMHIRCSHLKMEMIIKGKTCDNNLKLKLL